LAIPRLGAAANKRRAETLEKPSSVPLPVFTRSGPLAVVMHEPRTAAFRGRADIARLGRSVGF
jgi:hypothetical protein